jgi:putative phosphoribosyl transferase
MTTESDRAKQIAIPVISGMLDGDLVVPNDSSGIVFFAHGSGSNRYSPRNQYVARVLENHGLATLLIDLLTAKENEEDARSQSYRFNIDLLAKRLVTITDWVCENSEAKNLAVGYFGASTGAAAAVIAAIQRKDRIKAIVSRGGRPDLAGSSILKNISVPILLIVGSNDSPAVLHMHQKILKQLQQVDRDRKGLVIIQEAGHLFEEPGSLEEVAQHAANWFKTFLSGC